MQAVPLFYRSSCHSSSFRCRERSCFRDFDCVTLICLPSSNSFHSPARLKYEIHYHFYYGFECFTESRNELDFHGIREVLKGEGNGAKATADCVVWWMSHSINCDKEKHDFYARDKKRATREGEQETAIIILISFLFAKQTKKKSFWISVKRWRRGCDWWQRPTNIKRQSERGTNW